MTMTLPTRQRHDLVLALCVAGSLVLHGALLALWQDTPAQTGLSTRPAPLSIRLAAMPAPATQPPATPAQASRPATRTIPARPRATTPAVAAPRPVTVAAQRTVSIETTAVAEVQTPSAVSPATVLASVRQRLDDHFRYPLLARRRGWEGEVLLGFSVSLDGSLHTIHVARSSGHPLLDRSALESLQQVQRLDLLPGTALDLQLPVIYQLREG